MNYNQRLNDFLQGEKIIPEHFNELKHIAKLSNFNLDVLRWFRFLQTIEIVGWRNKKVNEKICHTLLSKQPIQFYSLLCPSYIKGTGKAGFRTDDVGNTTKNGIRALIQIYEKTVELGFKCERPEVIFFDVALEQPQKTIHMLKDLHINIENAKSYVPKDVNFYLLSEVFPELMDIVGYEGVTVNPLPIPEIVLNRIIERGGKFYELFGWSEQQIIERSKIIASSEAIVGSFLRQHKPNAIMVYTPTMLERAQVYSGKRQNDPLMIIFPNKKLE